MRGKRKFLATLLCATVLCTNLNFSIFGAQTDETVDSKFEVGIKEPEIFTVEEIAAIAAETNVVNRTINFNEGWKFQLVDPEGKDNGTGIIDGAELASFDDSSWRELNLPHDWSIEFDFDRNSPEEGEAGFLRGGTGYYRKKFVLPNTLTGKRISIDFGGVYMNSSVYVNGQLIGTYPNGYTPFSYDITDYVKTDGMTENLIVVKVINQQPSSRWYSGSGIYRDVDLTVTDNVHVAKYGTYITTPNLKNEQGGTVNVNVKTQVVNKGKSQDNVVVRSTIKDEATGTIIGNVTDSDTKTVDENGTVTFEQIVAAPNPTLWSVDNPKLYTMVTEILVNDKVVDTYESRFGFRYFDVDANEGFSLNGQYMKLKGVCMHHDQGSLGAVAYYRAIERQMQIMKDMGVNAIRVTHNPAADELLEICDRLGLLVIEEAFDGWYDGKKKYGYEKTAFTQPATHPDAKEGQTWAEFDLKQMVNRGKNFPSMIMWSIGNEIWETDYETFDKSMQTAKDLIKWVKEVDSTRPVTMGEDKFRMNTHSENARFEKIAAELDVKGFNYAESNYANYREAYPDWIVYGSETSSATKSRGIYAHVDSIYQSSHQHNPNGKYEAYQQSSFDNDSVGWGRTASNSWIPDRDNKYILGQFIWTGFDYIGEATPWHMTWPPKSSYFGIVDTAGFPKDDYYLYQSQWLDVEENPMVHIMPHWNWDDPELVTALDSSDGKIPVRIYSNAKKVELFKDGVSLGEQEFETVVPKDGRPPYQQNKDIIVTDPGNGAKNNALYLEWRLDYEPAELKAVAKDASGNVVATDIVATAGMESRLEVSADRPTISADGYDLSYITVDVTDADGNIVPTADNLINFDISGNGEIVGVDNGDALSHERYKDTQRKAFSGKALVIVQSTKESGSFTLTASSAGITPASVTVYTTASGEEIEKKIIGYDFKNATTTEIGVAPTLPTEVTAIYSDGSTEIKNVTWDNIDKEKLQQVNIFSVSGTVDGTDTKLTFTIIVRGTVDIREVKLVTAIGEIPELPNKVSLIQSDGKEKQVDVKWDREITADDVSKIGTFTIEGIVSEVSQKAKVTIRVAQEDMISKNIAIKDKTTGYPKTFASFNQGSGDNNSDSINDGDTAQRPCWNNWVTPGYANQETESIGLEFEKAVKLEEIGVFLFLDSATRNPAKIVIEYSTDGENWNPVGNQSNTTNFEAITTEQKVTFDAVEAKFIRLQMTGQPNGDKFKPVGIAELSVYSKVPVIEANSEAQLSELNVDGKLIEGFSPDVYKYVIDLEYGQAVPTITAKVADGSNASVTIIPALTTNSSAVVEVTSEDGKIKNKYVVAFNQIPADIETAQLKVDKLDISEEEVVPFELVCTAKDGSIINNKKATIKYDVNSNDGGRIEIVGNKIDAYKEGTVNITATVTYRDKTVTSNAVKLNIAKNPNPRQVISYTPVVLITDKNVAPNLPQTVTGNYETGFSRQLSVQWNNVDPSNYSKYGEFEVSGTVSGQTLRPTARVIVKGVLGVQKFSTSTLVNVLPQLPQKAMVYFSDNTKEQINIDWEDISTDKFSKLGDIVKVSGTVKGTELKTELSVRVSNEQTKGANIARQWTGSEVPAALASFTNDGAGSNDKVTSLNDTIVELEFGKTNRWSNWQRESRAGDWVGILFAESGVVKKQDVDNITVGFYEDDGTKAPTSFEIQYYTGPDLTLEDLPEQNKRGHMEDVDSPLSDDTNWQTVKVVDGDIKTREMLEYTFDVVSTYAIRLNMVCQKDKSLGITETEVYSKAAAKNNDFSVNSISINGKTIDNFSTDKTDYEIGVKPTADTKIVVDATNNASVTVVSAPDNSSTAKVIVVSENGNLTRTYNLRFSHLSPEESLQDSIDQAKNLGDNPEVGSVIKAIKDLSDAIVEYNKGNK